MTRPPAAPLTHLALYEQVAEQLRQRILSREIEPGAWIDELSLCAEWGISRTPMREAIKVLAAEGLVTMKVRRGAYVTEMSERDVREAYQLLSLLESDAASEIAIHATDAQLNLLEALHQALENSLPDRDAFFAANEAFHREILQIEGNRWRQQIVQDLRRLMKLNRHHSLFLEGRLHESLVEHRAILAALMRRDAASARQLVTQHFQNGLRATQDA